MNLSPAQTGKGEGLCFNLSYRSTAKTEEYYTFWRKNVIRWKDYLWIIAYNILERMGELYSVFLFIYEEECVLCNFLTYFSKIAIDFHVWK
jgi:hypothetical protein